MIMASAGPFTFSAAPADASSSGFMQFLSWVLKTPQ
jgi:hypothetical protein